MATTISFIGSGKVASALAHAFKKKGADILSIYSRNAATANQLAAEVGAEVAVNVSELMPSQFVVVAVKDDQIEAAVSGWKTTSTVIHTSGASELSLLKNVSISTAVAWPIHTFTLNAHVDFERVPVFVEGSDTATTSTVKKMFGLLSSNIHEANSQQRVYLHTCAVFANNFSNHCMAIAEKLLEERGYKFDVLKPVMEEHFKLLAEKNPSQLQTGPASRKDKTVLHKQLDVLAAHPQLRDLYRALSESIMQEKL